MPDSITTPEKELPRRTVLKGAAWSAPVLVASIAAPLAAATTGRDIGAFQLAGTCGILGVIGPGFTLTASATSPIPVGTTITITGTGVANIGVFSITGGTASVTVVDGRTRIITTTTEIPAGATIDMRTTLSISVAFTLGGTVALPSGWSGTDAKSTGTVTSTLVLCSAT